MKQYTPEDEKKCISDSLETYNFKTIFGKIKAYKHFNVGDVIEDESSKIKYKITYIESEFRLIYGRRVCLSGALSKNLHHITGMHSTFILDVDQVNALLLGEDYDPSAKAKELSKRKREAYTQRVKQRRKMWNDHFKVHTWCIKHLKIGQAIWITRDRTEDAEANIHKYTFNHFSATGIRVTDEIDKLNYEFRFDSMYMINLYITEPIVYKEML